MVDRYTPKISTITDNRREETHLISSRIHSAGSSGGPYCSTSVRTIAYDNDQVKKERIGMIEYRDSNVIRYAYKEDAEGEDSPDLELIDLIAASVCRPEESQRHKRQKIIPAVKVAFAESMGREDETVGTCGKKMRISEQSLFEAAMSKCQHLFEYLKDQHGDGRKIRVTHTLFKRREFGLLSARIISEATDVSRSSSSATVGVLWQTMARPQKAVCVNFSVSNAQTLSITCTCEAPPTGTSKSIARCCHATACCSDSRLMAKVNFATKDETNRYFGPCVQRGLDCFPAAELERQGPRKLKPRTCNAMQEWSFWVVFDAEREIFMPVVKVKGKPFQCLLCRGSTFKRGICIHEASCADARDASADHENAENVSSKETDTPVFEDDWRFREGTEVTAEEVRMNLQKYAKNNHQRGLLLCPGDRNSTVVIAQRLERLQDGSILRLTDCGQSQCPNCGKRMGKYVSARLRKVRLFTLTQGAPMINVMDWYCSRCRRLVLFTGKWVGVFPWRRDSAFTVELLYIWIQSVCYQGNSLRSSYQTSKLIGSADSTLQRFVNNQKAGNLTGEERRSRRRANEVFRQFLRTLDVKSDQMTTKLFSCENCEVPLNESDKMELGLIGTNTDGMKRFKAVVIDGTAAGILGSLPNFRREPEKLRAPRAIRKHQRMVRALQNRNAIKKLCSLAQRNVREILNRRKRVSVEDVQILLLSAPGAGKKKSSTMEPHQVDIVRIYLESDTCFCGHSWLRHDAHTKDCTKIRRKFDKSGDSAPVFDLLRACFRVSLEQSPSEEEINVDEDEDEEVEDDDVSLADSDEESSSRANVWVATFRVGVWNNGGQLGESLLDLVEFLLTEHTGLVYILPFKSEDTERFLRPGTPMRSCVALAKPSFETHKRVASKMKSFASCEHSAMDSAIDSATDTWPCQECTDAIGAEIINICNLNPVLTRFCRELLNTGKRMQRTSRLLANAVADCLRQHIDTACNYFETFDSFASQESMAYWDKYGSVLIGQTDAEHEKEPIEDEEDQVRSEEGRHENEEENAENENEEDNAENDYEAGNDEEGQGEGQNGEENNEDRNEEDEEEVTGICFPGRQRCRPGIKFETKETHNCNKEYPTSQNHSAGLLTVQCACENPKIIGFIVMERAESTALTLSAVLSHFEIPPRVIYYDNACNMFASTMLRTPWLLHMSRVVVDRFHYKGHKCSSFFDPDSYRALDNHRTTTAESINARIDKAVHHMRYLNGENLIPFLRVRFAFLNLAANYQQRYQVSDMEDAKLKDFLYTIIECNCSSCQWLKEDLENHAGFLADDFLIEEVDTTEDEEEEIDADVADVDAESDDVEDTTSDENEHGDEAE